MRSPTEVLARLYDGTATLQEVAHAYGALVEYRAAHGLTAVDRTLATLEAELARYSSALAWLTRLAPLATRCPVETADRGLEA